SLAKRPDDDIGQQGEALYEQLQQAGFDVLYDDRKESPGVKFSDADLIGIPWRITISARSLKNGGVEVKRRRDPEAEIVPVDQIVEFLKNKRQ
ncbi:MAG: hypothetical protein KDI02_10700, partial [Anaerolineae bacterium]|nr:hypothetical protein [Anaerolineae bacterium]